MKLELKNVGDIYTCLYARSRVKRVPIVSSSSYSVMFVSFATSRLGVTYKDYCSFSPAVSGNGGSLCTTSLILRRER